MHVSVLREQDWGSSLSQSPRVIVRSGFSKKQIFQSMGASSQTDQCQETGMQAVAASQAAPHRSKSCLVCSGSASCRELAAPVSVPTPRDLYWYRCRGAGSPVSRDSPRRCWAPEQSDAVSPRGLRAHRYRTVPFPGTLETALWEARGCLCPPQAQKSHPRGGISEGQKHCF